ncbi:hypothetical protein VOLCADRAFT_97446 [Volvox carteri f. nagariensis]|uniref:Leucine-rich repeat-containing N-terminal plant-type domain-containing protein n=1 Tax=Volvox carteri f. nagariensis TaxID=3068 RepID=D8UCS3_VOLCA|nr:uncharacterized protein VOLCADRAFT_97446 [Volvox carteri f. nagariensis]EFJ42392.1 hypothetical protein VOLCADRAFT_97446 [Volvox carteri f. nagariensis]|eukprot:XP_002956455.1 hypothetical protein VOLCADRAFT_97446 [Volvox carteri f. nagariensis]
MFGPESGHLESQVLIMLLLLLAGVASRHLQLAWASRTEADDAAVLLTLAGPSPPSYLSSWSGVAPCSDGWACVTCSGQRVTAIDLLGNITLPVGALPATISQLDALQLLRLDGAGLGGTLPPDLSALYSLTSLSLSYNSFTGILPASWSALANLRCGRRSWGRAGLDATMA